IGVPPAFQGALRGLHADRVRRVTGLQRRRGGAHQRRQLGPAALQRPPRVRAARRGQQVIDQALQHAGLVDDPLHRLGIVGAAARGGRRSTPAPTPPPPVSALPARCPPPPPPPPAARAPPGAGAGAFGAGGRPPCTPPPRRRETSSRSRTSIQARTRSSSS